MEKFKAFIISNIQITARNRNTIGFYIKKTICAIRFHILYIVQATLRGT